MIIDNYYSHNTDHFIALNLKNASNIRVENFHFELIGDENYGGIGIFINGSSNIDILNGNFINLMTPINTAEFPVKVSENLIISGIYIERLESPHTGSIGIMLVKDIKNINITNSIFNMTEESLLLGWSIENVLIFNNSIYGEVNYFGYGVGIGGLVIEEVNICYNYIHLNRIHFRDIHHVSFHNNILVINQIHISSTNVQDIEFYDNSFHTEGNPIDIDVNPEDGIQWYNEDLERGNYWFNYTTQNPEASHNGIYWNTPYEVAYNYIP